MKYSVISFFICILSIMSCGEDDESFCLENKTRCYDNIVEECINGEFVLKLNCSDNDELCTINENTFEAYCNNKNNEECINNTTKCEQDNVLLCKNNTWVINQNCTESNMECIYNAEEDKHECGYNDVQNCIENEKRCNEKIIEICKNSIWQQEKDCGEYNETCHENHSTGDVKCLANNDQTCTEGTSRCLGNILEKCIDGGFKTKENCQDKSGICKVDNASLDAECIFFKWKKQLTEIEDPIMNGSSIMSTIDNPSYDYNSVDKYYITRYGTGFDNPDERFLWKLNEQTGVHSKWFITGQTFPPDADFCQGEDWCQYIGFDTQKNEWVVFGLSTPTLMRVNLVGEAVMNNISGTKPPGSWISITHKFVWSQRKFYIYGALGPRDFGTSIYSLNLDTGLWTEEKTGLTAIYDNCLAYNTISNTFYSFGGTITYDGGETTEVISTYSIINLESETVTTEDMPSEFGTRSAASCIYDESRNWLYLYAGSIVNDPWNEILNEYHNDLWILNLNDNSWLKIMPDTDLGTYEEPDNYGDQHYDANPDKPNFGKNKGLMHFDILNDRLLIMGEVPIFTHTQIYYLELENIDYFIQ